MCSTASARLVDLHFVEKRLAGTCETRPRIVSRAAVGCSKISEHEVLQPASPP
jgi:hypothetical protein